MASADAGANETCNEMTDMQKIVKLLEQARDEGKSKEERDRWRYEEDTSANELSQVASPIAVVAVFLASLDATLYSFARDTFSDRPTGTPSKTSDSVVFSCFLVSIVLCVAAVVFASFTTLYAFLQRDKNDSELAPGAPVEPQDLHEKRMTKTYMPGAIGALLALLFLLTSVVPLIIGMIVLQWADYTTGTAVSVTVSTVLACLIFAYWIWFSLRRYIDFL